MKRVFAVTLAVFMFTGALSASAAAPDAKYPVVYKTARAIPTKSGEFVKITVYTKRAQRVQIRVDGALPRRQAERFATGCGKKRCSKWRIYFPRSGNECYELVIIGQNGARGSVIHHTVCEPFPSGSV